MADAVTEGRYIRQNVRSSPSRLPPRQPGRADRRVTVVTDVFRDAGRRVWPTSRQRLLLTTRRNSSSSTRSSPRPRRHFRWATKLLRPKRRRSPRTQRPKPKFFLTENQRGEQGGIHREGCASAAPSDGGRVSRRQKGSRICDGDMEEARSGSASRARRRPRSAPTVKLAKVPSPSCETATSRRWSRCVVRLTS